MEIDFLAIKVAWGTQLPFGVLAFRPMAFFYNCPPTGFVPEFNCNIHFVKLIIQDITKYKRCKDNKPYSF